MAKNSLSSMASRFLWKKWTVWIWFLSCAHNARHAWNWMPNLEALWEFQGTSVTVFSGRRTATEKPRLDIQWCWPLQTSYHCYGKCSCTAWSHTQELWQIWNWMLIHVVIFFILIFLLTWITWNSIYGLEMLATSNVGVHPLV